MRDCSVWPGKRPALVHEATQSGTGGPQPGRILAAGRGGETHNGRARSEAAGRGRPSEGRCRESAETASESTHALVHARAHTHTHTGGGQCRGTRHLAPPVERGVTNRLISGICRRRAGRARSVSKKNCCRLFLPQASYWFANLWQYIVIEILGDSTGIKRISRPPS